MTNTLKKITFSLWGILILIMAAATIAGKLYGIKVAETYIYSSLFFIGLWIAATILSLAYICKRHLKRRKATCALHLAFILILSGALTTHLWGIQGSVHLRQGANPVTTFTTNDGQTADFPFGVSLKQFELAYYQGTFAPMDFVSILNIHDGDTTLTGKASMNHIYTYRHYRFYQSAYDADQQGSTFFGHLRPLWHCTHLYRICCSAAGIHRILFRQAQLLPQAASPPESETNGGLPAVAYRQCRST